MLNSYSLFALYCWHHDKTAKEAVIIEVPAVLIVAYRRPQNLRRLLSLCVDSGIHKIYVQLDGPASAEAKLDTDECIAVLMEFHKQHPGVMQQRISMSNLGAALSVVSGCNWIFGHETFSIVLEDDCLPSPEFFQFVSDAKIHLDNSKDIFVISGSQPANPEVAGTEWCLSCYFLVWGWATTQVKWLHMYEDLLALNFRSINRNQLDWSELVFWKAGARRAVQGFVDAWDLPLMLSFRTQDRRAILPSQNLVTNVGNDKVATHTSHQSEWLGIPSSPYISSSNPPKENLKLDLWLRKHLYRISPRHIFSTKGTRLLDQLIAKRRLRTSLNQRLSRL